MTNMDFSGDWEVYEKEPEYKGANGCEDLVWLFITVFLGVAGGALFLGLLIARPKIGVALLLLLCLGPAIAGYVYGKLTER